MSKQDTAVVMVVNHPDRAPEYYVDGFRFVKEVDIWLGSRELLLSNGSLETIKEACRGWLEQIAELPETSDIRQKVLNVAEDYLVEAGSSLAELEAEMAAEGLAPASL